MLIFAALCKDYRDAFVTSGLNCFISFPVDYSKAAVVTHSLFIECNFTHMPRTKIR